MVLIQNVNKEVNKLSKYNIFFKLCFYKNSLVLFVSVDLKN